MIRMVCLVSYPYRLGTIHDRLDHPTNPGIHQMGNSTFTNKAGIGGGGDHLAWGSSPPRRCMYTPHHDYLGQVNLAHGERPTILSQITTVDNLRTFKLPTPACRRAGRNGMGHQHFLGTGTPLRVRGRQTLPSSGLAPSTKP